MLCVVALSAERTDVSSVRSERRDAEFPRPETCVRIVSVFFVFFWPGARRPESGEGVLISEKNTLSDPAGC